jgi:Tat protein secretion system quality control protein TatD with DNase activity
MDAPNDVPAAPVLDLAVLADSHCHYPPGEARRQPEALLQYLRSIPFGATLVCATAPSADWATIASLTALHAQLCAGAGGAAAASGADALRCRTLVPAFGIHPWWAHEAALAPDWEARLCALLEAHPAAAVGEIGLDKCHSSDWAQQLDVFERQLDIAARFQRPVSVHCVRAFGPMLTSFSKRKPELMPPAVILHGFTGSVDFAQSLLKLPKKKGAKFFFGVGSATTGTLKSFSTLLRFLPAARILLESDEFEPADCEQRMRSVAAMVAAARAELPLAATTAATILAVTVPVA